MLSLRRFGGIAAAALVLSVPAFAISALSNSRGTPAVPIEAKDDLASGLGVVNHARAAANDSDDPVVVIQKFDKTNGNRGSAQQ
jgi:hypothetical protein